MKKINIVAITALLTAILLAFSGCITDENTDTTTSAISAAPQQTEAVTQKKYSANDKLIALTFDDGPNKTSTSKILDILEKNNSAATFFVVGYNIENNIDIIRRAQALGCEIGNHSDGHKTLTKCTSGEIREQVDKTNAKLGNLTGVSPVLFRAPGGAFKGIRQEIGMPLIQWSIDTEDWKAKDAAHKNRTDAEREAELNRIADEVIENAQNGDIVLMHDIYNFTADLCDKIVPGLVAKGFKLVTVSQMYDVYGEELRDGEVYYSVRPSEPEPSIQSTVTLTAGEYKVRTNGGDLNIRIEPSQQGESIAKLSNGASVSVIKSVPGWAFVKVNGASGWVNASYLIK